MKNFKTTRLLGLMFAGCVGILQAPTVFAAAGDTINNQATLSFSVSGVPQSNEVSNIESFVEDRVVNFLVTEELNTVGTTSVAPDGVAGVTFTVTNNSNAPLDFSLTTLQGAGDNFDTITPVSYFLEDGTNDGYQVAEDTTSVTFLDEVAANGGSVIVHVVDQMPDDTVVGNGDVATVTLVAQAAAGGTATVQGADITNDDNGNISPGGTANDIADTAAMETVFNDAAGTFNSLGAAGAAQNGQHAADDSFTIASAEITVTKASNVIYDPVNLDGFTAGNNPKAIPGAYVQYTITIANAATAGASAELTTLSDILQSPAAGFGSLDLDPNLLDAGKVLGAALAFPADAEDGVSGTGIHVVVTSPNPTRTVNNDTYCTGAADADGCDYTGGVGGTVSVALATVLAAEAGWTAGELKADETVTITFNAIVQ